MLDVSIIGQADLLGTIGAALLDAAAAGSTVIQAQMTETGDAAMPDWALPDTDGNSIYMTFTLKLIQLLGIIGVLKGSVGIMRYVSPEPHPKKPPTVAGPLFQLLFGMLGMVPQTVVDMGMDILERVGWA